MINKLLFFAFIAILGLSLTHCDDDPIDPDKPILDTIAYNPVPYELQVPNGFPEMPIPSGNPLTVDGIALGRFLFYDPILSADSSMSCSSCHLPAGSFTDNKAVSIGIDGIAGGRSSMSLENVGFFANGLFWDGRSQTLEAQALLPIEDPIELHNTWPNVIEKLQKHPNYPRLFRKAFGITDVEEITKELAAKAISQFERIIISSGQSKFDKAFTPGTGVFLTDSEMRGYELFFQLGPGNPARDAQCGHCHAGPLFTSNEYFNNGIDTVVTLNDFADKGRGAITGITNQNGTFRTPSLRNIARSAPYMHDGRFQTLEEVIEHYASGGHYADNLSLFMLQIKQADPLTTQEKADVLAFLHTLTDTVALQKPELQNPF